MSITDVEGKVRVLFRENIATLDRPLDRVLGESLDKVSTVLSIVLDGQSKAGTLVDQVSVLEGPELNVQQSMLVSRGSSRLRVNSGAGTDLHVVLRETVLDVNDIAVGSANEEVAELRELVQLMDLSLLLLEILDLALIQVVQLLLLEVLGDGLLQGQPREVNLSERPYIAKNKKRE
jgi:hypothetical protein